MKDENRRGFSLPGGGRGAGTRLDLLGGFLATSLGIAALVGTLCLGQATGWNLPALPVALAGEAPAKDDWCDEHSVPESLCVECSAEIMPREKERGWCREHGIPECPLCHPELAQTAVPGAVTARDRDRAARALAFAPRAENNSKCKLHLRRIQVGSADALGLLGIAVAPAGRARVTETVTAPGEIILDPTRVARLSPREPGTVWRVEKRVGEKVRSGEVLALVEAPAAGRAKVAYQQALVEENLRIRALASLTDATGAVAEKTVQEAVASRQEARVRLLNAEQALANLGLMVDTQAMRALAPAQVERNLRFLGIPGSLAGQVAGLTASNNLLAVASPLDGEVVASIAVAGEAATPAKPLFTVADTGRMRLSLKVRLEDAGRLKPGQTVRFQHAGHDEGDAGAITWVSPAADEKTRAVPVRVDLPNPGGRHHANTFGTARILLREEPDALVVPSEAVHWEGDCHVVFVRDKDFDKPGAPRVFHVRKVRPGAVEAAPGGPVTEIIAGLLPGEQVATANSGILRSELLKNNLGEG